MFFKYNFLTILWAIFILILTLTPGNAMPDTESFNIPNSDKIAHFSVFGVFAYLMYRGFTKQHEFKKLKNYSLEISLLISVCFGIIIEFLQTRIPGRGFDLLDILANTSGIALGLSVYYLKINNKTLV